MERLHVKPGVIPCPWPQRSANQLQPHMHAYSTWAWSHTVLHAHLLLPLWSKYKYMCTVSEDRKKPRIFFYEGWETIENEHMAGCHVKLSNSSFLTYLNLFCNDWTCLSQQLPALNLRWQLLSGWALNTSFTPAADEAWSVMSVAVPHRILHCILGFFLTGHPIIRLLRRMHTKKWLCGEDLSTNAKLSNYIQFLIYDHGLRVIRDLNWRFCPHTVA